ncbi:MAG: hypothetical protein ACI9JL_000612 [Paracoccaceae bacterium]|jgi:hypothetical protein
MTIADLSLVFDLALAGLLAVMIFYAVRLNKRIAVLRDGEGALQQMIGQFSESSLVAQESARQLKAAGTEAEFGVKAAIAKGMALRNDLEMMLDQADLLVARMDDDRYRVPPAPPAPAAPAAKPLAEQSFDRKPSVSVPTPARASVPAEMSSPRPEWPEPVSNVKPFSPPVRSADEVVRATAETSSSAALQPRSEAERHLLDAIRAAKEGTA